MNSLTEENYLKALLTLSGKSGEVGVNELSRRLGTKMSTVTSMMKTLSRKRLVSYEKYKPLRLTGKGKREAALILRKHRLAEMFLVEKMGFGWEEVHSIAEEMEHIIASQFFERMDKILGFPRIDPHGEPIPDKTGKIVNKHQLCLSDCEPGDVVKFSAVSNSSYDLLNSLNNHELQLGTLITVKSVDSFDRSLIVNYGKRKGETLSHKICERLMVQKLNNSSD
jgi:DtxR family transcriptional regulator, Mn-dependent transcriptional regulator